MSLLAINTDSFHYKYYQALRRIWNFDDSKQRTNLCTYTQFLFWFSLLTLVTFPFILGGWLLLKTGRLLYKICSWTSLGKSLIDILDEIGLGDKIDELSDKMSDSPAFTLMMTFFGALILLLGLLMILLLIFGGIIYIKIVFIHIIAFMLAIGFGCFHICFGIGWVIINSLSVILAAIKWAALFAAGYVSFLLIGMCMAIVLCLLAAIIVRIFAASETLSGFISFRLNGYYKARTENAKRREEIKEQYEKEKQKRLEEREKIRLQKLTGKIPYTLLEKAILGIVKILKIIFEGLYGFFIARTKNAKGGTVKVMGVLGILIEALKSIKYGICPFVEFISNDDLVEDKVEKN